jgi:methylmalonyl-CoA mutase
MTTPAEQDKSASNSLPTGYTTWRTAVERELKGVAFEKRLVTRLIEGIEVQPLYRREDMPPSAMAAAPTEPPFLRGTKPAGRSGWQWTPATRPTEYDFTPLPALAVALARAKDAGSAASAVVADPLGCLASRGVLPLPLADCFRDLAEGLQIATEAGIPARIAGIGTECWHEAGATAVQELAFAVATGAESWRRLLDLGATPAAIGAHTQVGLAVGVDFFLEIAKLRAARVLWCRMTAAFGADVDAQKAWLTVCTARWDKTLYDTHVNLLRLTTEALSAVVGGADAIEISAFDELTGEASELGRRMSRNLHDILAEESSLASQVDPAGGSWYVEALTDQLARKAWALFQDLEQRGGMAAAILAGYPQQLAAKSAEDRRALVDTRRRPILGTTVQPNLRETPRRDSGPAAAGAAKRRSAPKPIRTFAALRAAAAKRTTLPTLRAAWIQHREAGPTAPALQPFRAAEGFEAVRRAGDDFLARTGARARVFLAKMGPREQHKARADFAAGFFAIAGFELDGKKTFGTAEEAADAASSSGAAVAVLCSTDDTYPQLAPAFAQRLKAARPAMAVVLAGHPGDREAEFRAAGFDEFIHIRANVRTTLSQLQRRAGILS